jgi:pantoate--beta-alanine ligase
MKVSAVERFDDPASAARWCAQRRAGGATLGFVPTMGALHAGHLGLVAAARERCDLVVVSVFVNPLQFDDEQDFDRYPRDFASDAALLSGAGCDMVFTGTLEQFFPGSGGLRGRIAWRDPGPAALGLEGDMRPGHFAGVATIVARLFEVVGPEVAFFGAKDFQQTLVVRDVSRALGGPRIEVCATRREAGGLALSSRNALLSAQQREQAGAIYRALCASRAAWRDEGLRSAAELALRCRRVLAGSALEIEYAEVRDPERWSATAPVGPLRRARVFVAARLGGVRLIDNLRLDGDGEA